ncbi:DUF305 domain-containing protein [Iamia majanohamensis]|uniref:DUF305 domain-containing protein n=1 Tax=Iamia majanohamensis TaxID=467976 RepID=A0AAE9Y6T1_9ACTN|nr:DUF305 domain-containing protein [Iamia majanohamensis]WCO67985.1 DUF305 domain-containing protein [Iamia majanohamensis]
MIAAASVCGVLVAAAIALVVGLSSDGPGEVEIGFARDMRTHHMQAVQMAGIIRDRSDDPRIVTLATDIELTQQAQMGQMRGWLDAWGDTPNGSGAPMAWIGGAADADMTMSSENPAMPGMATDAQIRELSTATGTDADLLFLRLMIEHHRGGVVMAQAARDGAEQPEVVALATSMVAAQQAEITAMEDLMKELT